MTAERYCPHDGRRCPMADFSCQGCKEQQT